jgi:hypothetical protein
MMDRCDTPYYIQVDEDMILGPDTIKIMYNEIIKEKVAQFKIAMHCYLLHDVHLNKDIEGIKIYRTDIFKQYPYKNGPSCEVEQLERMAKDGYNIIRKQEVVGFHAPKWTNEGIFERYYNLSMKYRLFSYHWMGQLQEKLQQMYKDNPSDLNFYALAGCKAGLEDSLINEEKNANKKVKAFEILQKYLGKI